MRLLNKKIFDSTVALSENGTRQEVEHMVIADVIAQITANNPSNVTFDTGTMEIQTLTFPAKASATDGDYIVIYDASGTAWAVALDTTGGAAATPTGAAWTAVAAGNKDYVDISGDTTAAQVAATVEAAINALTGFTAVITTDDTAADGTMTLTQVVPGTVTNPDPHSYDDMGVGSITGVESTAGVATEVNVTDNTVTVPSHGLITGTKVTLTTTGTLPAGLSTGTDYYVIVVDSSTLKFATSQSNASAGTAIDITNYGTSAAVHTIVVTTTIAGTLLMQKNNVLEDDGDPVWEDIGSAQAFTGTDILSWALADVAYNDVRMVATVTSGTVDVAATLNAKGG